MSVIEISLTEALLRKKRYADRISKEVRDISEDLVTRRGQVNNIYADYTVGGTDKTVITNKKVDDFTSESLSSLTSILSLISNYENLCRAINLANCTTDVTINCKTMKICEAIALKNSDTINLYRTLSKKISTDYYAVRQTVNKHNDNRLSQDSLNKYLESILPADNRDLDKVEEMTKNFKAMNTAEIIDVMKDGLSLIDLSKKIDDETDAFCADVDLALAEANSKTIITVELED